MHFLAIATALLASFQLNQAPENSNATPNQKLLKILDRYQENQSQLYAAPFAFFGQGQEFRDNAFTKKKWYLCVREDQRRRLDASGLSLVGSPIVRWSQMVTADGVTMLRPTMRRETVLKNVVPEKIKLNAGEDFPAVPQPVRMLLSSPRFGYDNWRSPDAFDGVSFLSSPQASLLGCEFTREGSLKATYRLKANFPTECEIIFDHTNAFLPSAITTRIELQGEWRVFSVTEPKWMRRDSLMLPSRVTHFKFPISANDKHTRTTVDLDWKIGEEVSVKIDPKRSDWREPFRELFPSAW